MLGEVWLGVRFGGFSSGIFGFSGRCGGFRLVLWGFLGSGVWRLWRLGEDCVEDFFADGGGFIGDDEDVFGVEALESFGGVGGEA